MIVGCLYIKNAWNSPFPSLQNNGLFKRCITDVFLSKLVIFQSHFLVFSRVPPSGRSPLRQAQRHRAASELQKMRSKTRSELRKLYRIQDLSGSHWIHWILWEALVGSGILDPWNPWILGAILWNQYPPLNSLFAGWKFPPFPMGNTWLPTWYQMLEWNHCFVSLPECTWNPKVMEVDGRCFSFSKGSIFRFHCWFLWGVPRRPSVWVSRAPCTWFGWGASQWMVQWWSDPPVFISHGVRPFERGPYNPSSRDLRSPWLWTTLRVKGVKFQP